MGFMIKKQQLTDQMSEFSPYLGMAPTDPDRQTGRVDPAEPRQCAPARRGAPVAKEQHAQQQLLAQKAQSLEDAQSALIGAERANEALEQRCGTLQEEVSD